MKNNPESKFKKELKAYLKSIGAHYIPIAAGAYGMKGSADMVVCYRGAFIHLEAKWNDGRQSGWQDFRQGQVERAGGLHATVWTMDDAIALFESLDYLESPFK